MLTRLSYRLDLNVENGLETYRQRVFVTILRLSVAACILVAVAYLLAYINHPVWTEILLSLSFGVQVVITLWCLWQMKTNLKWAVRVFLASGSTQVFLFMLFNENEVFLVGLAGGVTIIAVSSFLEPRRSAYGWAGLIVFYYLLTIFIHQIVDFPIISFSQTAYLAILQIWTVILLLLAFSLQITGQTLLNLLENSEKARLRLEEQEVHLIAMRLDAEKANVAKSKFLSNMSHELRTPLNAILGFAQLMVRDPDINSQHKNNLGIIQSSGSHLLMLINDILEMTRIETGNTELMYDNFNLHTMLETTCDILRIQAETKDLYLLLDYPDDLIEWIYADQGKIRQILVNLLANAIKYTDKGGAALRVRHQNYHPPGGEAFTRLYFEIEDSGKGIAKHEMDRLFQPFSQSESGRQSQEGTGLGLTITQEFVELMNGHINMKSEPGQGTMVTLNIQVESGIANQVTSHKQNVLRVAPHEPIYRILAVDDRAESRLLLGGLMKTVGFEVYEASDGQEAIDMWQTYRPHLIWMDVRMPILSGYEAVEQIRTIEAQQKLDPVVIIALTASAFEHERRTLLQVGCNDFVAKPFREEVLFSKIEEHLRVDFIYNQVETDIPDTIPVAKSITQQQIAQLSPAMQQRLYDLAEIADMYSMNQLVQEIKMQDESLAEALQLIVNRFAFDEILALLQEKYDD